MLKFIIKRILAAIPTMLVLITVSFFLMRLAPGSPFTGERNLPPAVLANIEAKYHLNDPMYLQYFHYVKQLAQGDLGPSFKYKDFSVNELLAQALPVSLEIGLYSFVIAAVLGMLLGIVAALKQNTWADYTLMTLAMTGVVVPSFVKAPILVLIFAVILQWLPAGGWNDGALPNLILPVAALSISYVSSISRITRGAMIEVLNSPFIRTARAKGLPMRTIVLKHALRPALLPIVSYLGPALVGIIRRDCGGNHLQPARHRPAFRQRRTQPRLRHDPRADHIGGRARHPLQRRSRHPLCPDRSKNPLLTPRAAQRTLSDGLTARQAV
ncbi:putative oligopeptide transport system permease protein OppB [Neisseria sp. oral taxon 020 str. F0370]|nr:putative oligopeptide transport system permease protein OppB [Neisseria sp. oral taxon 020 str. F0370]